MKKFKEAYRKTCRKKRKQPSSNIIQRNRYINGHIVNYQKFCIKITKHHLKPKKISASPQIHIIGQTRIRYCLRSFLLDETRQGVFVVVGKNGCGKTSLVHEVAKENNFILVEQNAAVFENELQLCDLYLNIIQNKAKPRQLLFLDEAEHYANNLTMFWKLVKKNQNKKIICACNQKPNFPQKLYSLNYMATLYPAQLLKIAKQYMNRKKIQLSHNYVQRAIKICRGDARKLLINLSQLPLNGSDVFDNPFETFKKAFSYSNADFSMFDSSCKFQEELLYCNYPCTLKTIEECTQAADFLSDSALFGFEQMFAKAVCWKNVCNLSQKIPKKLNYLTSKERNLVF